MSISNYGGKMSEFQTYLQLGFDHISDLNAYDHILFIIALCAAYPLNKWRSVILFVTAFTVGHSITLALATLHLLVVPSNLVETLIPVTILVTCFLNIFKPLGGKLGGKTSYVLALLFGLIHGLGFSNYLRALLGVEESIIAPLFFFNIGLELGQLMILALFAGVAFVFLRLLGISHRRWNIFISGAAAGISVMLLLGTN